MGGGSPLEGGEALGLSASLWGEQVISYVGSGGWANRAASRACRASRTAESRGSSTVRGRMGCLGEAIGVSFRYGRAPASARPSCAAEGSGSAGGRAVRTRADGAAGARSCSRVVRRTTTRPGPTSRGSAAPSGGPDYWARVWGARGLLHIGPPARAEIVLDALSDESWRVREMSLKVIRRHGLDDPDGIDRPARRRSGRTGAGAGVDDARLESGRGRRSPAHRLDRSAGDRLAAALIARDAGRGVFRAFERRRPLA